jgi:hypothetical protein
MCSIVHHPGVTNWSQNMKEHHVRGGMPEPETEQAIMVFVSQTMLHKHLHHWIPGNYLKLCCKFFSLSHIISHLYHRFKHELFLCCHKFKI